MSVIYRTRVGVAAVLLAAVCLVFVGAASLNAQTVYSFENTSPVLDGWTAGDASIVPSTTFGVTDGSKSMLIDNLTSSFKNNIGFIQTTGGTDFGYFSDAATAIAAGKNVKLEFDFSWDLTNVTGPAAFAQLGMFLNSGGPGYTEYQVGQFLGGNVGTGVTDFFPRLDPKAAGDGVSLTSVGPNTIHLAIPLGASTPSQPKTLNLGTGSTYYQVGFKSNGGWGGTMDWAIDNIKFSGAQTPTTSQTLFSWETPDNPATTGVDERFEGWVQGGVGTNTPHIHSIVTTGATDGTHALQIDRTGQASGFTWGSSYSLNSVVNPGPSQTIDPTIQGKIDSLISKISAADFVAFDVTYQYKDQFPAPNPTYTQFGLFFTDDAGHQFQAFGPGINISSTDPAQHTATIKISLADFLDFNNANVSLKTEGFHVGSNTFEIALATNTDGAQVYQLDNFRLLTNVSQGVPGDYNGNGVVDMADYVLWRNGGPLQNEVNSIGTVDSSDYTAWRANFGHTSGSGSGVSAAAAVPEPASFGLILAAMVGGLFTVRSKK